MKHKKSMCLIIGLMTVALLGVVAMQYFFIRQSYVLKAQLFDESVKAALNAVASKAEKREVMQLAHAQRKNKEKQIGRAHVCTPVTNAHLVCRTLLEKKKDQSHKMSRPTLPKDQLT